MAIYNLGRIDGLSAYEVWLENGNEGTKEEFLASLKGEKGDTGEQGPAGKNGSQGPAGADGFSPTATVEQTDTGAIITIKDKNGTTTATVKNGKVDNSIPKLVTLTQAEYDALVSAGTVDDNTYYFIKEE